MNMDTRTMDKPSGGDALNFLLAQFAQCITVYSECFFDLTWHDLDDFACRLQAVFQKSTATGSARNNTGRGQKKQPTLPDDFDRRFPEPLGGKLREWLAYKTERRDFYTPTGLRNLLTQIENRTEKHSVESVVDLIAECMANNWRGIIWERIVHQDKPSSRYRAVSRKTIKGNEMSPWDGYSFDQQG